jgi:hypothetical protein
MVAGQGLITVGTHLANLGKQVTDRFKPAEQRAAAAREAAEEARREAGRAAGRAAAGLAQARARAAGRSGAARAGEGVYHDDGAYWQDAGVGGSGGSRRGQRQQQPWYENNRVNVLAGLVIVIAMVLLRV